MKGKKAQIDQLVNIIVPLVGVGIVIVVSLLIMSEAKEQVHASQHFNCSLTHGGNCTGAFNATVETISAISDIPQWLPIIVITVIGALLIGLVSMFRKN